MCKVIHVAIWFTIHDEKMNRPPLRTFSYSMTFENGLHPFYTALFVILQKGTRTGSYGHLTSKLNKCSHMVFIQCRQLYASNLLTRVPSEGRSLEALKNMFYFQKLWNIKSFLVLCQLTQIQCMQWIQELTLSLNINISKTPKRILDYS